MPPPPAPSRVLRRANASARRAPPEQTRVRCGPPQLPPSDFLRGSTITLPHAYWFQRAARRPPLLRKRFLVNMPALLLYIIEQQVLPQCVRSREIGFSAADFRHFLHEVHQAVIARQH